MEKILLDRPLVKFKLYFISRTILKLPSKLQNKLLKGIKLIRFVVYWPNPVNIFTSLSQGKVAHAY